MWGRRGWSVQSTVRGALGRNQREPPGKKMSQKGKHAGFR